jgi:NAD(P)-dependent dehydrogenase (short-subunit alcohol dehydrogenase family)
MSVDLSGRVAVISGGLGDIGKATALELARCAADVAVCDLRDAREADSLRAAVTALGRRFRYDRVDVSDAQAVAGWIAELEQAFGAPDLIIANAAIVDIKPLERLSAEYWRRELSVNLDGAFHLTQVTTARLIELRRPGRVVFVGSWAADHVHVQIPTYCVGKAAVRMLCRCMAAALAPAGILVNEIAPGYVDAGLASRFMQEDPAVRETSRREVPIQLLIEPEEVAREIAHLCDPANRHMTGATVVMDGGLSLVRPVG